MSLITITLLSIIVLSKCQYLSEDKKFYVGFDIELKTEVNYKYIHCQENFTVNFNIVLGNENDKVSFSEFQIHGDEEKTSSSSKCQEVFTNYIVKKNYKAEFKKFQDLKIVNHYYDNYTVDDNMNVDEAKNNIDEALKKIKFSITSDYDPVGIESIETKFFGKAMIVNLITKKFNIFFIQNGVFSCDKNSESKAESGLGFLKFECPLNLSPYYELITRDVSTGSRDKDSFEGVHKNISLDVKIAIPKEIYLYEEIFSDNDERFIFNLEVQYNPENISGIVVKISNNDKKDVPLSLIKIKKIKYGLFNYEYGMEMPHETTGYKITVYTVNSNSNKDVVFKEHSFLIKRLFAGTNENILLDETACSNEKFVNIWRIYDKFFTGQFEVRIYVQYIDGVSVTIYDSIIESKQMLASLGHYHGKLPFVLYPKNVVETLCTGKSINYLQDLLFSGYDKSKDISDLTVYYDIYPSKNSIQTLSKGYDRPFYLKLTYRSFTEKSYEPIKGIPYHLNDFRKLRNSKFLMDEKLSILLNYYKTTAASTTSIILNIFAFILILLTTISCFYN
uniref:Dolichyl-diphosphooligosaccharide--protein glycosyltransferase subunit 1 n=1 Tax=Parastrongyloides trichosuri TaxID=131310 RepID=A0A0N4ZVI5_PARTI